MFQRALQLKLRFDSVKGNLTSEDLWDLNLKDLNILAKKLNIELKAEAEEDFLETEHTTEKTIQLKFDLVIHVIKTKQEDNKNSRKKIDNKRIKDKILEIIARKKDSSLEAKSEEELLKDLEKLEE